MTNYQMTPQRRQELDEDVVIFNFSPKTFYGRADRQNYVIRPGKRRLMRMRHAYRWFGNPTMRKRGSYADVAAWENEVARVKRLYMTGKENSGRAEDRPFFDQYIKTGQVGCYEVLERFIAHENITFADDVPVLERLKAAAAAFYGRAVRDVDMEENDRGGLDLDVTDLAMFGVYTPAEGQELKGLSDEQVIADQFSTFGSAKTPTRAANLPTLPPGATQGVFNLNAVMAQGR